MSLLARLSAHNDRVNYVVDAVTSPSRKGLHKRIFHLVEIESSYFADKKENGLVVSSITNFTVKTQIVEFDNLAVNNLFYVEHPTELASGFLAGGMLYKVLALPQKYTDIVQFITAQPLNVTIDDVADFATAFTIMSPVVV